MAPHVFPRQGNSPIVNNYFAGGLIGGFVVLVVLLCLLCHFCLRRSPSNKMETEHQGGVTRPAMMELDPSSKSMPPPHFFSRHRMRSSIVMPDKTIFYKQQPSQAHGSSGKAVSPTQPLPPSPSSPLSPQRPASGISTSSNRPRSMSLLNPAWSRQSRASAGFSLRDRPSSHLSSTRSASPTHVPRPVRQPFEPLLSDELALQKGEYITVLQSFDDGWCLVARERSRSSRASRLSAWMKGKGSGKTDVEDVDVGLAPSWVFIKPHHGVTVTRPFRSTSVQALGGDERTAIISWSNFS